MERGTSGSRTLSAVVHIIKTSQGRLGNQIHPYAAILAYCAHMGLACVNDSFAPFEQHFEGLMTSARRSGVVRAARWRLNRLAQQSGLLGATIQSPSRGPFTILPPSAEPTEAMRAARQYFLGWRFSNPEGIERHRGLIKRTFRPIAAHRETVDRLDERLGRLRPRVGVHIRHGDFRHAFGGKLFLPLEVFVSAMRTVHDALSDDPPVFVVCSDEARGASEFPGLDVVTGQDHFIADLYKLAACDLVIGTNSSFAAWATVYSGTRLLIADPTLKAYDNNWPVDRDPAAAAAFARMRAARGRPPLWE